MARSCGESRTGVGKVKTGKRQNGGASAGSGGGNTSIEVKTVRSEGPGLADQPRLRRAAETGSNGFAMSQ